MSRLSDGFVLSEDPAAQFINSLITSQKTANPTAENALAFKQLKVKS